MAPGTLAAIGMAIGSSAVAWVEVWLIDSSKQAGPNRGSSYTPQYAYLSVCLLQSKPAAS
jgi:hypothetical protein